MYKRFMEKELKELAKQYPIVTILGPRQSGKTTLVKKVFPKKAYVNLENLDTRQMAQMDPRGFLEQYLKGAILDEIQHVPDLLSYIQVIVDEKDKKGLFILTGSHQLKLHAAISQSLAGRTALLKLLPLSVQEISTFKKNLVIDELLLKGGYPRVFKDRLNPTKAYANYFQTYVEKDLRDLMHIKDLSQFKRFIHILAGRIGQLCNFATLATDVGVSANTIKEWISILESSFVIFRLQPYFENFGKRLIKAPKIYFSDIGLAAYLLGIENLTQMKRDPLRGHLVENLIILELVKFRFNEGKDHQLYFFRDLHGHEIDVIYQKGHILVPIEIKAAMTFNKSFLENLQFFEKIVNTKPNSSSNKKLEKSFLIYTGKNEQRIEKYHIINYQNITQIFL